MALVKTPIVYCLKVQDVYICGTDGGSKNPDGVKEGIFVKMWLPFL